MNLMFEIYNEELKNEWWYIDKRDVHNPYLSRIWTLDKC